MSYLNRVTYDVALFRNENTHEGDKMNIELYPHNQETYQKIIETWLTDNRVATVQATGTGKSMLILKCLFTYPSVNKIVLAPSHHILNQLADKVDELPNTILMTYAKLARMSEDDISSLNVKIIVLDEFHRCGAKSWGDGVSKLINNHPEAKVLGTTATPIRYLDGERDMTDELFDGKVVTNLSLPQAIVKGILPMPKYVSALYTYDEEILNLHDKINNSSNTDEEKDDMRKEVEQMKKKLDKSKGIPVILKKHLGTKSGKFIVFCRDKKHLFEMKETVVQWFIKGRVASNVIDYSIYTGKSGNNKIIKDFRDANSSESVHLLFAIDKLNEGLHVDDIDGVIFLRSTMSPIIYYQQLGRAVKVGGKEPYVFDLVNNFSSLGSKGFASDIKEEVEKENKQRKIKGEQELELSDFVIYDEMQDVIELFGSVESRLRDSWDAMFELYCSGEGSRRIRRWESFQRSQYSLKLLERDRIEKLNHVGFVWDFQEGLWSNNFNLLKKYKQENRHLDIPQTYELDGIKLGLWVFRQRAKFKKEVLGSEKIKALESLGLTWNPSQDIWETNFNYLMEYKKTHNDCNVPYNYVIENVKLGIWVNNLRRKYLNKMLEEDKIRKLENVGFTWSINGDRWNHNYRLISEYRNKYGHTNVPTSCEIEGVKLGIWASNKRQKYKKNKISQEEINNLNDIGFEWVIQRDGWERNYELLLDYVKCNGNSNIPYRYEIKGLKLGKWVCSQRQKYKQNKLSKERIDRLNSIEFDWEPKKAKRLQTV
ncbi:Helicase associated domain protein [Paenibacillus xylanexedens]|uniref:Helicase associated domain protein n=1 Tax=Paenibacillus xylanexedens TaxID=528191 RepID=UPI000F52A430|nr:Helicase associated domain protein [Paenibacillus xylanexedens]RPK23995.1 hypothetical protein EDO6_04933 [Paenibacillus xylanexedens]